MDNKSLQRKARKAPTDKKVTILLQQDKEDMLLPTEKDLRLIRELLEQQSKLFLQQVDVQCVDTSVEKFLFEVQTELTRQLIQSAQFYAKYAKHSHIESQDLEQVSSKSRTVIRENEIRRKATLPLSLTDMLKLSDRKNKDPLDQVPQNAHVFVPLPTASYIPEFHMESEELKMHILDERDEANFERQQQLKNLVRQAKESYMMGKLEKN